MSFPVSVCIIAKNEEKHIEECLRHLLPYGMEIIVTDTGSDDRTKELASRYADKVLNFEWTGDFSAARNFCVANARNNWILVIDCDEYVQALDTKSLRMLMQKYPKSTGQLRLRNITRRNSGMIGYVDEDIVRFYNRNYYEFAYPIHECIAPKNTADQDGQLPECFLVPAEVIHHGYNISELEMQKKQERNLQLLYASLEMTNERIAYTYFQIGQSEQVLGNIDRAIENYTKCLETEDNIQLQYIRTCIVELATAYAQKDESDKALALLERYKDKITTARITYTYGLALLGTNQPLKALFQLILASAMPDSKSLGEDLMYCYRQIIQLYTLLGEPQLAEPFREKYHACVKERENTLKHL